MIWASTTTTKLLRFYRLQKHAIRTVIFKTKLEYTKPLFTKMKILNIFEINIFQIICLMFNCKLGTAPKCLSTLIQNKPENKYKTRSHGNLFNPTTWKCYRQFAISFRGPKLWNNFQMKKITAVNRFPAFKQKLKQLLLESGVNIHDFV